MKFRGRDTALAFHIVYIFIMRPGHVDFFHWMCVWYDNLGCFRLGQHTGGAAEARHESCGLHWQVRDSSSWIPVQMILWGRSGSVPSVVSTGSLVTRRV